MLILALWYLPVAAVVLWALIEWRRQSGRAFALVMAAVIAGQLAARQGEVIDDSCGWACGLMLPLFIGFNALFAGLACTFCLNVGALFGGGSRGAQVITVLSGLALGAIQWGLTIGFDPAVEFHGQVQDERGQPVPGVAVRVFSKHSVKGSQTTWLCTDAAGRFTLDGSIRANEFTIQDFQRASYQFETRADSGDRSFVNRRQSGTAPMPIGRPSELPKDMSAAKPLVYRAFRTQTVAAGWPVATAWFSVKLPEESVAQPVHLFSRQWDSRGQQLRSKEPDTSPGAPRLSVSQVSNGIPPGFLPEDMQYNWTLKLEGEEGLEFGPNITEYPPADAPDQGYRSGWSYASRTEWEDYGDGRRFNRAHGAHDFRFYLRYTDPQGKVHYGWMLLNVSPASQYHASTRVKPFDIDGRYWLNPAPDSRFVSVETHLTDIPKYSQAPACPGTGTPQAQTPASPPMAGRPEYPGDTRTPEERIRAREDEIRNSQP